MRADLATILSDLETPTTEQALKRKFDQKELLETIGQFL